MLYSTLAIAAVAGLASAQNYSTSGPLTINVTQVEYSLRQDWCLSQQNNCPLICNGRASPNYCDATTLNYTCTCTDGSKPNITDYDGTIPSFVCAQWIANCVDGHPNDRDGINACRSVVCGSKKASSGNAASGSSVMTSAYATVGPASSTTGGASTTASSTTASTSAARTSGAAVALHVAQNYGTGIVAAGIAAAFGLAL